MAEGETLCITGVTRNPALAKEVTVSFQPFSPTTFNGSSDVLSLKVLTRLVLMVLAAFVAATAMRRVCVYISMQTIAMQDSARTRTSNAESSNSDSAGLSRFRDMAGILMITVQPSEKRCSCSQSLVQGSQQSGSSLIIPASADFGMVLIVRGLEIRMYLGIRNAC